MTFCGESTPFLLAMRHLFGNSATGGSRTNLSTRGETIPTADVLLGVSLRASEMRGSMRRNTPVRCGLALICALTAMATSSQAHPESTSRPADEILAFAADLDGTFSFDPSNNSEIFTVRGNGAELKRLTRARGNDISPSWSPDGRHIVFRSSRDGNDEIYVMRADGKEQRRLTRNPTSDRSPVWSPDGRMIAFASERNSGLDIYVMRPDGTGVKNLTRSPGRGDEYPSWSPDGTRIVFQGEVRGNWDIYMMRSDGSRQRRLTRHRGIDGFPAWSPNGQEIAFDSELAGGWADVHTMDPQGHHLRKLTSDPAVDAFAAWSSSGKHLSFASDRGSTPGRLHYQLYTLDLEEQRESLLVSRPGWAFFQSAWRPKQ